MCSPLKKCVDFVEENIRDKKKTVYHTVPQQNCHLHCLYLGLVLITLHWLVWWNKFKCFRPFKLRPFSLIPQ